MPTVNASPAVYAANVMLFVPRGPAPPYFKEDLLKSIQFVMPDLGHEHLIGILRVDPALTFSTLHKDASSDPDLPVIALPVPKNEKSENDRWRVLPGAPLAFVKGVDGYSDALTLSDWFDQYGDFPQSVKGSVLAYFKGKGSLSRSFVSRGLAWQGEKVGVLNLHANRPELLGVLQATPNPALSVARREEFLALMTPLLRELEATTHIYMNQLT